MLVVAKNRRHPAIAQSGPASNRQSDLNNAIRQDGHV
jgi:hypothetical protein